MSVNVNKMPSPDRNTNILLSIVVHVQSATSVANFNSTFVIQLKPQLLKFMMVLLY